MRIDVRDNGQKIDSQGAAGPLEKNSPFAVKSAPDQAFRPSGLTSSSSSRERCRASILCAETILKYGIERPPLMIQPAGEA